MPREESRWYLQITYSSLFPTSLNSGKEKVPHMGKKVVSRFWKQLECKSRSRATHQRKSCVGCKTGWILGTGTSSSRNDYHAKVWNLWRHLPSKDTSELVTDAHLGPWKVECRYFPGTRQFPWLLCNLREGWGLNILLGGNMGDYSNLI